MHQYASMRTTIDLPDDLYRTLKARAALRGITLRELVRSLVEQGLRQPTGDGPRLGRPGRADPPPVIVPRTGKAIRALSATELRRIEEDEDLHRV